VNILFITHQFYPAVGGTEANAEFLAQALHGAGINVHLVTWTTRKGVRQFPYTIIRSPSWKGLIKEHRWADIVFENSPVLRLSWPSFFFRKPLIVVLNTWLSKEDGSPSLQAGVKYWWLKRASGVIAVSNAIRAKCWPDAVVIENAYNDELFNETTPWEHRSKTFVFLGRLVSDKGADMAIRAVAKLITGNLNIPALPGITLTIIGDGTDAEQLKGLVKELKLDAVVSFKGNLSGRQLVDTLNQHKFMLIPSKWEEPFGIVALEGMACGCIPIVSDGGGLPEAVGEAGLVFKRGDLDDMIKNMLEVVNDQKLQRKLRHLSASHLQAHSKRVISDRYLDIIKQAFNKN
jgi:glycosyltransferase involved in cell wall biosynthesis